MADARIVLQEPYTTNEKRFRPMYQYCYDSIVDKIPDINEDNLRNKLNFDICYKHYKVIIDSITYYIPCIYAPIFDECLPEIIPNNFEQPDRLPQDTIQDYILEVKECMGIDMKRNYGPQRNGDYVQTKILLPVQRVQSEEEQTSS